MLVAIALDGLIAKGKKAGHSDNANSGNAYRFSFANRFRIAMTNEFTFVKMKMSICRVFDYCFGPVLCLKIPTNHRECRANRNALLNQRFPRRRWFAY